MCSLSLYTSVPCILVSAVCLAWGLFCCSCSQLVQWSTSDLAATFLLVFSVDRVSMALCWLACCQVRPKNLRI